MEKPIFELSNEQRRYLGLIPVEKSWEPVKLADMFLYFDGNIIRKKIEVNDSSYHECELNEKTAENRTILLPKTAKGKPKKLNFTGTQSFSPFGVYFSFSKYGYISIASYTTQTTFFSQKIGKQKTLNDLQQWLKTWINETSAKDLEEIEFFKNEERKHCKFKEGDFFTFKIGRRQWGFGRILLDVVKLKKTPEFKKQKNLGLNHFMGKPLIVKVYHKISHSPTADLNELSITPALPSQPIMDNHFYYGEHPIIGNRPVSVDEMDPLISYSRSISALDPDIVYVQYGLIYKELPLKKFNKYLYEEGENSYTVDNPYRNEGVGFGLDIDQLEECIKEKSNSPYWNTENHYGIQHDLRNPRNLAIKKEIFNAFGLNADKDYAYNLQLVS